MKWLEEIEARWQHISTYTSGMNHNFLSHSDRHELVMEFLPSLLADIAKLIAAVRVAEERIKEVVDWIDSGEPRQARVCLTVGTVQLQSGEFEEVDEA